MVTVQQKIAAENDKLSMISRNSALRQSQDYQSVGEADCLAFSNHLFLRVEVALAWEVDARDELDSLRMYHSFHALVEVGQDHNHLELAGTHNLLEDL
jgi:hypothetical protein